ncbi:serine hydrolase [Pontixanthobacter aquaemixtae]|uniref:Serine hydrolase n=1 Tax=Pontixanthobacter aquaemixtae TaxID=1958940 RepID=A0A844ZT95_9SPHN|nr:serine hydrolase [Pontixanthobacter aquaemixtae]MXO90226.1 serine hydrolase [Pontixanthobacter aquaemixtae]
MLTRLSALSLLLAAPFAAPVAAQTSEAEETASEQSLLESRADDALAVMQGTEDAQDMFAQSFLDAVSAEQFAAFMAQVTGQFGAVVGVESITPVDDHSAEIVFGFEKALGIGSISIEDNAPNKINGLLIRSFETLDDSLAKVEHDLNALPGEIGVLFARLDGSDALMEINPDSQFAIGSTFKLYILSALARSIEKGEREWSDVVTINRRSFPSGRMQNWPDGAPVTLQTLATMMITISDNTATDMLFYELGREAVEAELRASGHSDPDRTLPFLSTLQMFGLKGSPGNLAKYVSADEAGQRFILADFEDDVAGNRDLITPPRFTKPLAIDTVEWFASGRDLEKLMKRIIAIKDPTARKIMAISPSMPDETVKKWDYIGYKGGSEPGVLNLTWLLRDEAGAWWILAMSWNNTEASLDDDKLELLSHRLIALAAQ